MEDGKKVISIKLDNYKDKYEGVDRLNEWSSERKRVTSRLDIVLIIVAVVIFFLFIPGKIQTLIQSGDSLYMSLRLFYLFIPVFIALIVLHELIHYIFLWSFSKQRPQVGVKFPNAYAKLRAGASISRNQGLIGLLSPFLFITIFLITATFFVKPIAQVVLITLVLAHGTTCSSDFLVSIRLLRYRKNIRLAHEYCEGGFETVLFNIKANI
jgi:hypothetical protein